MKGSRKRSRELALQALYQWLVSEASADELLAQLAEHDAYSRSDQVYLAEIVKEVIRAAPGLRDKISPHLDRPIARLSPVEHALLLMAACELLSRPDTPYRVIINEAVELAKSYGGTDGYKYVNGVLDKLAAEVRVGEVGAVKRQD